MHKYSPVPAAEGSTCTTAPVLLRHQDFAADLIRCLKCFQTVPEEPGSVQMLTLGDDGCHTLQQVIRAQNSSMLSVGYSHGEARQVRCDCQSDPGFVGAAKLLAQNPLNI